MNDEIKVDIRNDVAIVMIDREERRNALDHNAVNGLRSALVEISANNTKVMVITGAGTKSFCAGDDIKAYADRTPEASRDHFANGLKLMSELEALPCVTIAAIEGYCMGGGLELALNCDLRFASSEAVFALPEVRKLKANPTWGGLTKLHSTVGLPHANQLVFLGEKWDAETARAAGLITRVMPPGEALANTLQEAEALADDLDLAVVRDAKAILHAAAGRRDPSLQLLNLLAERAQPFQG